MLQILYYNLVTEEYKDLVDFKCNSMVFFQSDKLNVNTCLFPKLSFPSC